MREEVLVVSRDDKLVDFLQRNLPHGRYHLTNVPSGDKWQSILGEVMPDLVIMDIVMPRLNEIAHCLSIRRLLDIPVLMLSTWETGVDEVRGLDPFNDSYLTEPYNKSKLLTQVEGIILRNSFSMN